MEFTGGWGQCRDHGERRRRRSEGRNNRYASYSSKSGQNVFTIKHLNFNKFNHIPKSFVDSITASRILSKLMVAPFLLLNGMHRRLQWVRTRSHAPHHSFDRGREHKWNMRCVDNQRARTQMARRGWAGPNPCSLHTWKTYNILLFSNEFIDWAAR